MGFKAFFQIHDEVVGIGQFRRVHDFLVGGFRAAVANVFHDIGVKEVHILLYHADGFSQALQGEVPHVVAVYHDGAAIHIPEAGNEVADGGLPRAGGPHQGHFLSRANGQMKIIQHLVFAFVGKVHVVEGDGALGIYEIHGVFFFPNVAFCGHDFVEALDAGKAFLEGFGEVDDAPHRGHHGGDVHNVGHHIPGKNVSRHHVAASGDDDDKIHDAVEVSGDGIKARHGLVVFPLGFQKAGVLVVEAGLFHVFVGEGFRDADAGDGIFDGGI